MERTRSRRYVGLAATALALLCLPMLATAAEEPWGYALAHDLMSPFCPGRTLAACPSPQADELRIWILQQEAAGATPAEVEAMLIERYGEEVLGAPRAEGLRGFSAYAIPTVGFVLGGGGVLLALRRMAGGRREPEGSAPGEPVASSAGPSSLSSEDAELERLVDQELQA